MFELVKTATWKSRNRYRLGIYRSMAEAKRHANLAIKSQARYCSISQGKASKTWTGPKDYQTVEFICDDVSYVFSIEKLKFSEETLEQESA